MRRTFSVAAKQVFLRAMFIYWFIFKIKLLRVLMFTKNEEEGGVK